MLGAKQQTTTMTTSWWFCFGCLLCCASGWLVGCVSGWLVGVAEQVWRSDGWVVGRHHTHTPSCAPALLPGCVNTAAFEAKGLTEPLQGPMFIHLEFPNITLREGKARDSHEVCTSVCVCVCLSVCLYVCACVCLCDCVYSLGSLHTHPLHLDTFTMPVCLLPRLRRTPLRTCEAMARFVAAFPLLSNTKLPPPSPKRQRTNEAKYACTPLLFLTLFASRPNAHQQKNEHFAFEAGRRCMHGPKKFTFKLLVG